MGKLYQFFIPQNGYSFSSKELEELKEQYDEAVYEYYQTDSTTMSDLQFDELKEILEDNGYNLSGEDDVESDNVREKLSTANNMISLYKVQVFYEEMLNMHVNKIISWLSQYRPVTMDTEVMVGWKLDGCASSLRYDEQGNLIDVVTRGNFSIAKKMLEVAMKQHPHSDTPEIRCEMVMNKHTFIDKGYSENYANARNLVAGIVNDININDPRKWDITFVKCNDGLNANTHSSDESHILPYITCKIKDLPQLFKSCKEVRGKYEYPTDGLVVYLQDVEDFRHVGKYPLHSIAIKFPPVKVETAVKEIRWNLKKSGEYIPKAILEPVDLDGSTVQRTLCFNYGFVKKNKVFPGAIVEIAKNGDIIPYIQKVVKPGDENKMSYPENTIASGIHLYPRDAEQIIARERFIAGCYTLGIKNFGYSWFRGLSQLCNNDITNIFNSELVNTTVLKQTFGGYKKAEQFMKDITSLKELNLYQVIRILQIPGAGPATAKQIANALSGIEYTKVGLEKKLFKSCVVGEYHELITSSVDKLKQYNINVELMKEEVKKDVSATYEMTGSPKMFGFATKSDFQKKIPNWGHTKLDKTTTYLITDDKMSTSSKMQKAHKLGVKILTYQEAIEIYE